MKFFNLSANKILAIIAAIMLVAFMVGSTVMFAQPGGPSPIATASLLQR